MRPLRYLLLFLPLLAGGADYPSWWLDRGVIVTNGAMTNDFAGVNAGQLKWMVLQARDELDAHLPGGAGTNVAALVDGFTASNNYPWVNLGQLKNAACRFHERLIAEGYATNYPWTAATTDDCDYAAANLGQLKNLFSFELRTDSDQDGMPDWWESHYFGNPTNALPTDDADGDGYLNVYEAMRGGNPTNVASIPVATRYVSPTGSHSGGFTNWACAATNIQAALDAATSDCEIIAVANGVYVGTGNAELTFPTDRPVMLVSTGGARVCVVDCQRVAGKSGIKFMGGQDRRSVLKGITIRNIYAEENSEAFGIICSDASPTILNCRILDATSDGALLLLSGILCEDSSAVIRNTVVANCRGSTGNAIETHGQGLVSVENCTIVRNRFEWGGGIGGEAFVRNCIVWGNSPGQLSSTSVSYSLVEGGWAGDGNFSADPKLSPYGFWLMSDSPCIDAGAANTLMADWEGENRHDDPNHQGGASVWDIGADEFVDSDGDGGSGQFEIACGTDPQDANSQPFTNNDLDGDTLPDWWETLNGLNPQSGADAYEDQDEDGLWNILELQEGTDPQRGDSDGDGCTDGAEFYAGTDAWDPADYPFDARDHFAPYGGEPQNDWSVDVNAGLDEQREDESPGRLIPLNNDDDDHDGVMDSVDGYNANGVAGDNDDLNSSENDFVPIDFSLDGRLTSGGYKLSVECPSNIRLWTKEGDTMRKLAPVGVNGGSLIVDGAALKWNQGFMGNSTLTLYAEGTAPGEGEVALTITHYWDQLLSRWRTPYAQKRDSAKTTILKVEFTNRVGMINYGFEPRECLRSDTPWPWTSVSKDGTNEVCRLIVEPATAADQIEVVMSSGASSATVSPTNFTAGSTDLTITGQGSAGHAIAEARIKGATDACAKLNIRSQTNQTLTVGIYYVYDTNSPSTYAVGGPTAAEVVNTLNDIFHQAQITFVLTNSCWTNVPYDSSSKGVNTNGMMDVHHFGMNRECDVLQNGSWPGQIKIAFVKKSGSTYEDMDPGCGNTNYVRGAGLTPLVVFTDDSGTNAALVVAHEVGHNLTLAFYDDDRGRHDNGPWPGTDSLTSLMIAGTNSPTGLVECPGRWLRHEDWQSSNEEAATR